MSVFRPDGPRSPSASPRWIDRWLAACSELAELERSNPMTDAVIDEIDGRMIRIGDKWLADFASCNYLGFDLDREIIEAIPEYLDKWGTHPSWSRMLGSPVLYPQIEERLIELLGCEDALVIPTITLIHLSVIPVLAGDGTIFVDNRAHKTIYDGCQFASARGATVKRFRFEDPDDLEQLLRQDRSTTRLICMDGVNSMTGNAPDLKDFARLARRYDAMLYVDDAHGFGVIGERDAGRAEPVRHAREQHRPLLRRVVRPDRARRRLLEVVLVARGVRRLPDRPQGAAQDRGAALPLLGAVADRLARDRACRLRRQRGPRRRDSRRPLAEDRPGAPVPRSAGSPHAEPFGLPDHRGSARAPRGHRRGGTLPLRPRHLRDARRLPARAEERGRVPDPGHGGELPGRDRAARSTCSASSRTTFDLRPSGRQEYAA